MALNKLALIRYKTIDECLNNKNRKWTLEDLRDKVTEALYEYEGIRSVSIRTIQSDIQLMRSDKLGYDAPIVVKDRKYYTYSKKDYSITKINTGIHHTAKLKELMSLIKQFEGFQYFNEMGDMLSRMENFLFKQVEKSPSLIHFESNPNLKGLQFVYPLYQALLHRLSLLIEYQSFNAVKSSQEIYYPYLLKEYRNRWFLLVRNKKSTKLTILALDRMISFQELPNEPYVEHSRKTLDCYFEEMIGVTREVNQRPVKVLLRFSKEQTPYVLTKPIHHSQKLLSQQKNYLDIRVDVIINYELEREILGFGEGVEVLAPQSLAENIHKRKKKMLKPAFDL